MNEDSVENALPEDFYVRYDIGLKAHNAYNINFFETIGWSDPFPSESRPAAASNHPWTAPNPTAASALEVLVYDKSRYVLHPEPSIIYFPNKEIMLKLMRAAIDLTEQDEFWFEK